MVSKKLRMSFLNIKIIIMKDFQFSIQITKKILKMVMDGRVDYVGISNFYVLMVKLI